MEAVTSVDPQKNHSQDTIRVKNPTNQDFTFYWDSLPHTVRSGEEADMERWMAYHYAKKIIVAIVNSKITKVKEGDVYRDSLKTNDPNLSRKLLPLVLLYVVRRWIETPPVEKNKIDGREFSVENFEIGDKPRQVNQRIELESNLSGEETDPFNLVDVEPTKEPEAPTAPPEADVDLNADVPPSDSLKLTTPAKKPRTLAELQAEARALELEITGQETKAELETKILEVSR